jgi:hypothetical protein
MLRFVDVPPVDYLDKSDNLDAAIQAKDWNETYHEHACRIVQCGLYFYVIWAND